jgi:hypothetical protein
VPRVPSPESFGAGVHVRTYAGHGAAVRRGSGAAGDQHRARNLPAQLRCRVTAATSRVDAGCRPSVRGGGAGGRYGTVRAHDAESQTRRHWVPAREHTPVQCGRETEWILRLSAGRRLPRFRRRWLQFPACMPCCRAPCRAVLSRFPDISGGRARSWERTRTSSIGDS